MVYFPAKGVDFSVNYEIINVRKKLLGITNAQLSEMTGISLSTLDKITSGKKNNPTLDTLQAIADAIGCSIDEFRDNKVKKPSAESMRIAMVYDELLPPGKELIDQTVAFAEKNFKK